MNEAKFKSLTESIVSDLIGIMPEKAYLEINKSRGYIHITLDNMWEYIYIEATGKKTITKPWEETDETLRTLENIQ